MSSDMPQICVDDRNFNLSPSSQDSTRTHDSPIVQAPHIENEALYAAQTPSSVRESTPITSTPMAGGPEQDARWLEWREWREWKMRKEWDEFCRWEVDRKAKGETTITNHEETGTTRQQAEKVLGDSHAPPADQENEPIGAVRTEYVLSGQPTGWAAIDKVIRDYDEEKVRYCKEDIDTLLVFAGLFSAVLTAFLIDSYQNLRGNASAQDPSALRQLSRQETHYESILHNRASNSTAILDSFQPSSVDIRVNVLWFASLLFSLIAASLGILVKQWLREYMVVQNPSPQARLRLRHLRYPELAKWKVFEIAAALPLLLQLSLALFFVGLCYFTASVHSSIGYTTLPLVICWAFCFVAGAVFPLFFPRCPYRITLLKHAIRWCHRVLSDWDRKSWVQLLYFSWYNSHHSSPFGLGLYTTHVIFWRTLHRILRSAAVGISSADEADIVQRDEKDLDILAAADAIQSNDELLNTAIAEAIKQGENEQPVLEKLETFLRQILANRLVVHESQVQRDDSHHTLIIDLRRSTLSSRAQTAVLDIVHNYLQLYTRNHVANLEKGFERISVFTLAALFALSGRKIQQIPHLAAVLSTQTFGPHIAVACRLISKGHLTGLRVPAANHYPPIIINLLEGVSVLHRSLKAQWKLVPVWHSIMVAGVANPVDDYSDEDHDIGDLTDDGLASLGRRTMRRVASWPPEPRGWSALCVFEFVCDHLRWNFGPR
ncbi:hypothetical protein BDY19DRAFT_109444 [Irpex rosettiformis]|uniref:Uncharacterized protein n=1 Tax=Irpex rosettiformis TaxID=378272 RepID=A0ACB8U6G2_9APHY|nr:hypothetical protein BDY19DRAFT_109444 [Irpex rosettiformis]